MTTLPHAAETCCNGGRSNVGPSVMTLTFSAFSLFLGPVATVSFSERVGVILEPRRKHGV